MYFFLAATIVHSRFLVSFSHWMHSCLYVTLQRRWLSHRNCFHWMQQCYSEMTITTTQPTVARFRSIPSFHIDSIRRTKQQFNRNGPTTAADRLGFRWPRWRSLSICQKSPIPEQSMDLTWLTDGWAHASELMRRRSSNVTHGKGLVGRQRRIWTRCGAGWK